MDNEEEKEQQYINHSEEQDANHQLWTTFSGELLTEEEEDMLELRLSSHRPSRPQPSVFSQPQLIMNPLQLEIHQLLSNTYSQQNPVPTPQPHATNPPPNHFQVSSTHPLYGVEPLPLGQEPIFYPINSFDRPNGQSSIPPIQATAPLSLRSQPPIVSQQDVRPLAMQMTAPQAVVHQDVSPIPIQIPPPVGPPVNRRGRRNSNQAPGKGKSEMVSAPFPWATTRRATVCSLNYLLDHNIEIITGTVECKRCEKKYEMEYNVVEKYMEVGGYIFNNMSTMHDRAPDVWGHPLFPTCKYCKEEKSVRPVFAKKKKEINWLFLFLGQMIGCCTLEQLRYFCKHTQNHRTGAKDRLLYLTYLCLFKQLDPTVPFDV